MKKREIVARLLAVEDELARLKRLHGAKYLRIEDAAAVYGFKEATLRDYVFRLRLFTKYRQGGPGRGRAGGRVVLAVKELDAYMEARAERPRTRLAVVGS